MKFNGKQSEETSAIHSIWINAVQILALAAFTAYIVMLGPKEHPVLTALLIVAAVLTISGALMDIA